VWAEITWSEVSDSDLDHYELQISTAADFSSDLATRQHQGGGDRRERFTGLVGNTLHYVRVRAADWVGNTSAWDYGGGSPYSFTSSKDGTPPAQVAGLSAASSRTLAGLSWTASGAADLRHYEIQRAPGSAGSPGAWATLAYAQLNFYIDQDFSDAQIAALDTFWYRVRAIDTSGNPGDWATQTDVALGQIDSDHIAASAITADKIAANAITAVKIVANAVTADKILAGAVTATKINVSTLSAISADMGLLTAGEIRVGTGTVGANFTGFRIMSTYLGGYNNDVLQFYLQASDGSAMFGAGGGRLDASGLGFVDGAGTANSIVWNETNFAGDIIGAIYADVVSDDSVLWLTADTETEGGNAIIIINAAPVDVFRTGLGVRLNVNSNGTINASRCTDFLIHDGTRNWVDLVSGGDLTFDIATAGSFEIANAGVGIIVAHFDGDGGANILNGLSVGTAVVDYRSLSCDGTIRTEEGNKWNLGGVNTGTITPDRKIAVEIDGQFYTLAAQLGLV